MKPNSIVQFERLYLGSILVWLARQMIGANDSLSDLQQLGVDSNTVMISFFGMILVVLLIAGGVWYMIARRKSVIFKWLLAVWFLLNTCVVALALFRVGLKFDLPVALDFVGYGLGAWALSYLFKPDADTWFAKPAPSA